MQQCIPAGGTGIYMTVVVWNDATSFGWLCLCLTLKPVCVAGKESIGGMKSYTV